jgi:hypothetical protein
MSVPILMAGASQVGTVSGFPAAVACKGIRNRLCSQLVLKPRHM